MARFRATIQGSRGAASRLGGKEAGARASVNGWNVGVNVFANAAKDRNGNEGDRITLYITGGSNNPMPSYMGHVEPDGVFVPSTALRDQIIADYVRGKGKARASARRMHANECPRCGEAGYRDEPENCPACEDSREARDKDGKARATARRMHEMQAEMEAADDMTADFLQSNAASNGDYAEYRRVGGRD